LRPDDAVLDDGPRARRRDQHGDVHLRLPNAGFLAMGRARTATGGIVADTVAESGICRNLLRQYNLFRVDYRTARIPSSTPRLLGGISPKPLIRCLPAAARATLADRFHQLRQRSPRSEAHMNRRSHGPSPVRPVGPTRRGSVPHLEKMSNQSLCAFAPSNANRRFFVIRQIHDAVTVVRAFK
jgi:hypothetical protein